MLCIARIESINFLFIGNFGDSEIGKEVFDAILDPGDLLYFPRGVIHQGKSLPDTHSLHITISTYQRNTWGDVMEKVSQYLIIVKRFLMDFFTVGSSCSAACYIKEY